MQPIAMRLLRGVRVVMDRAEDRAAANGRPRLRHVARLTGTTLVETATGGEWSAATAIGRPAGQLLVYPRRSLYPFLKRFIDIVLSALMLVLLLPLIAVIAFIIRLDSPGPVFFSCDRVGWTGRLLPMLKFRKMHDGARGPALTLGDDERFTRAGRWLARFKLDEIPQFWHVLRGEMSLVGPRPESEGFVTRFAMAYDRILEVRPGIFGLSQLAFAKESQILDPRDPTAHYVERILPQKVAIDRLYVQRLSLRLDLRILFWSAVAVLFHREVAVHRGTARLSLRRRPACASSTPARSAGRLRVAPNGVGLTQVAGSGETTASQRLTKSWIKAMNEAP